MTLSKPYFFDAFRCIASLCPDSCCKEWAVVVDPDSAAYYRSLPTPLGDRLRQVLAEEDGDTVMTIEDGRCPMWRNDGLCRIQAELGEQALCKTCREFPRLTHDYGDFVELGLELSCPEAARIILSADSRPRLILDVTGNGEAEYDEEAMAVLKATREEALKLIGEDRPEKERLALLLLYGCQAQGELDGGESFPFDVDTELSFGREMAGTGNHPGMLSFFRELEILNPRWHTRLEGWKAPALQRDLRPLLRYFIERYWLQAVSDYDLYCRVKYMIISCLLIEGLPGDLSDTAQAYSKEIENNTDNVEAILDAAYSHPAFTDAALLGLLLGDS